MRLMPLILMALIGILIQPLHVVAIVNKLGKKFSPKNLNKLKKSIRKKLDASMLKILSKSDFDVKVKHASKKYTQKCTHDELVFIVGGLEGLLVSELTKLLGKSVVLDGHLVPYKGYVNPFLAPAPGGSLPGASGVPGGSARSGGGNKPKAKAKANTKPKPKPAPMAPIGSPVWSPAESPVASPVSSPTTARRNLRTHESTQTMVEHHDLHKELTSKSQSRQQKLIPFDTGMHVPSINNRRLSVYKFVWGGTGSYRCRGCDGDENDQRRALKMLQRLLVIGKLKKKKKKKKNPLSLKSKKKNPLSKVMPSMSLNKVVPKVMPSMSLSKNPISKVMPSMSLMKITSKTMSGVMKAINKTKKIAKKVPKVLREEAKKLVKIIEKYMMYAITWELSSGYRSYLKKRKMQFGCLGDGNDIDVVFDLAWG